MAPFENDDLGAFTLVRGPNEQGKTLLIDALVRMLFKKHLDRRYQRYFGTGGRNMKRVAERPEGFVVLESKDAEHKLESKQTIQDVFPFKITPDDFRNVFVVRDSDLSLRDEDRYYFRVTEKLTGLRSSEIDRLLRAIQKRGRLRSAAPDSELANNVEQGKIADKVRDSNSLVGEIRAVKESLLADRYDELENEMISVRDRLTVLGREAELQKAAEETRRYGKAKRALGEVRRMTKTLAGLDKLDSDQLKLWQTAVTRRESLNADVAEEKREAEKVERATRTAKKAVSAQDAGVKESEERLNRINAELKSRIDDYQYERAEFRRAEPQFGTYRKGLYAAAGLTALALIGYMIHPSIVIAAIGGVAFAVWLSMGWKQLKLRSGEGRLRAKTERLEADIKHCGIEVESVDEVMSAIGDMEREQLSQQRDADAKKSDLDNLIKEKMRIEGRIQNKSEQIAELDGEIATLKTATDMESLADYHAALEKRTKLEAAVDAKRTILRDMLSTDLRGEEALADWDTRISAHLQAAEDREQVEFDAEAHKRIVAEVESLEERKREIQSALLQGSRKLHGVEVKAKELGVLESSPPCRTTQELDHIGGLIAEFCQRIERDRRTAQEAIHICRQIDDEERARVSDLFGPDSLVTAYVSHITDGRYTEVQYDPGKNHVYLLNAGGDRLPADFLSGGAYDQLYLAIRVTIAAKLLSEEKGFLILDDPFVKADSERLGRMMEMLRRLVEDGWQILYFSAKEEIARALADDIAKGRVQLVELEATALPASEPEPVSDETTDTDLVDDAEESVDDTGDIKDASDVEDAGDVEETGDAGEAGSARTPDDDSLQPPPLF
jgi:hypothetical protein